MQETRRVQKPRRLKLSTERSRGARSTGSSPAIGDAYAPRTRLRPETPDFVRLPTFPPRWFSISCSDTGSAPAPRMRRSREIVPEDGTAGSRQIGEDSPRYAWSTGSCPTSRRCVDNALLSPGAHLGKHRTARCGVTTETVESERRDDFAEGGSTVTRCRQRRARGRSILEGRRITATGWTPASSSPIRLPVVEFEGKNNLFVPTSGAALGRAEDDADFPRSCEGKEFSMSRGVATVWP